MGLLSSLGLPELGTLPSRAAQGNPVSAPTINAAGRPARKPVGPVVDAKNLYSLDAGPIVNKDNIAAPHRTKTIARIEPGAAAAIEPPAAMQGAVKPRAVPLAEAAPPMSIQVEQGKDSVAYKKTADSEAIVVKHELKKPVFKKTFMVGPVPCFTKGDVMLSVEGEVSRKGNVAGLKVQVTAAGAFGIGFGIAEGPLTIGPLGTAELSSSQGVAVTYSEADGVTADAFVCEVVATGSVGVEATIDNGPTIKVEAKLVEWHLLVVHVAGFANGKFSGMRVEPGRDLQRLVASLESAGKRISKAVDDAGDALERGARAVIDPGGSTGREDTERVNRLAREIDEIGDDFGKAMYPLRYTDLKNFCEPQERQEIVDSYTSDNEAAAQGAPRTNAWKSKAAVLIGLATQRKAQANAAEVMKREKAKAQVDEDLKRRVRDSEARVVTAWKAMENLGNPLNHRMLATGDKKLADCWSAGMRFRDPGSLMMKQLKSFEGDARIAKADEVTGLFERARVEFQRGSQIRS